MLYFFHRYELPLYEARHPRAPTIIDLNEFGIHVVAFVQQNPLVGWLQHHLDRLAEQEDDGGRWAAQQQTEGEVVEEDNRGGGGEGMDAGEDRRNYCWELAHRYAVHLCVCTYIRSWLLCAATR